MDILSVLGGLSWMAMVILVALSQRNGMQRLTMRMVKYMGDSAKGMSC